MDEPNNQIPALAFKNLTFSIEEKTVKEQILFKEGKQKCILDHISGTFYAGEMVALMGASGCGKTTLMDILACRKSYGNVEGDITYSGVHKKKLSNTEAGYVPQSDIALANLTVSETIDYAIDLRIPDVTREKRKEIRTKVMHDLMIYHCRKTKVGNNLFRGLSGGELRRLSIAQDLVNNPSILFLDEPTSGLDSYASFEVVSILKELARSRNQLIIMTIHQPSSQIFHIFDKLLLLTKSFSPRVGDMVGRVGYYGPVSEVKNYFGNFLNLPCPETVNIADHIINETVRRKKIIDNGEEPEMANFGDKFLEYSGEVIDINTLEEKTKEEKSVESSENDSQCQSSQSTSVFNQYTTLTSRSYLDIIRSPDFFFNRILKIHIIGFLVSTIYWRMDYSPVQLQNRVSATFFILLTSFMLSQAYIPIFIIDRPMANREKGAGLYGPFVQLMSQLTVIMPVELFNGFIYITYVCWITNLYDDVGRYFMFALMFESCLVLLILYGLLIGSFSTTAEKAAIIAPLFFMFALVVCGFFIIIDGMPVWWRWARWLSPLYYALSAALFNEFNGLELNCTAVNCTFTSGDELLSFYSINFDSYAMYWAYQCAVWGFTLLCYLGLFLCLKFLRWDRT